MFKGHFAPSAAADDAIVCPLTYSPHALEQFQKRAVLLGVDDSESHLLRLLAWGRPEKNAKRTLTARSEIFKRNILNDRCVRLTFDGWRFVVTGDTVATVERVLPHENFERLVCTPGDTWGIRE